MAGEIQTCVTTFCQIYRKYLDQLLEERQDDPKKWGLTLVFEIDLGVKLITSLIDLVKGTVHPLYWYG